MTEREPIEIGTERRPMECSLTIEERLQRSDQVHSEIEQRTKDQAAQETLEAEAKAKKEEAKAIEQRISQRDLRIKNLSQAARTGKETREVKLHRFYDPTTGEVFDRRSDTNEILLLKRRPTTEEQDEINRKQQLPLKTPEGRAVQDLLRTPKEIPDLDIQDLEESGYNVDSLYELGVGIGEDVDQIDEHNVDDYLPGSAFLTNPEIKELLRGALEGQKRQRAAQETATAALEKLGDLAENIKEKLTEGGIIAPPKKRGRPKRE